MVNAWYDRAVAAFHKRTWAQRKEAFDAFDNDLKKLVEARDEWRAFPLRLLGNPRRVISERVGHIFVGFSLPANGVSECAKADVCRAMQFELTKATFALAAYRADHGSYPAKLADLVPKYVAEVPKDIFADADLHYAREGDGYLLYSVGVNGKDDEGRTREDCKEDEDWDDEVVRMK